MLQGMGTCIYLYELMFSFYLDKYSEVQLLAYMEVLLIF